MDPDSCSPGGLCWTRVRSPNYHLKIHGTVKDTNCKPIPNAMIEVWQTDGSGIYGFFFDPENKGCFGAVKSKKDGNYSFVTWRPGSYGFDTGMLPFGVPPYLPQHIHIAVSAPGFEHKIFQLYFEGDPSREYDVREMGGDLLQANHSSLALSPQDDGTYTDGVAMKTSYFDIVMTKDPKNRSYDEQWEHICQTDLLPPPALCNPPIAHLIRHWLQPLLICIALAVVGTIFAIGSCCMVMLRPKKPHPAKTPMPPTPMKRKTAKVD